MAKKICSKYKMGTCLPEELTLEEIPLIMIDIIDATLYLQEQKIMHRDIKPDNICLVFDQQKNRKIAKLCDFGTAKFFDDSKKQKHTAGKGTKWYRAPEAFDTDDNYDCKCDIFSIGMTFLDISILARKKKNVVEIYEKFYEDFNKAIFINNYYNYKIKLLKTLVSIEKFSEIAFIMIKEHPNKRKSLEKIREMLSKLKLTKDDINNNKINQNYKIEDFKNDTESDDIDDEIDDNKIKEEENIEDFNDIETDDIKIKEEENTEEEHDWEIEDIEQIKEIREIKTETEEKRSLLKYLMEEKEKIPKDIPYRNYILSDIEKRILELKSQIKE